MWHMLRYFIQPDEANAICSVKDDNERFCWSHSQPKVRVNLIVSLGKDEDGFGMRLFINKNP